mgnify:CR=1 FL=1
MPKIRPRPRPIDVLRALFLKAEQDILNEILRKNTQGYVDYAETAAMERVQATLQGLVDESWEYVPQVIKRPFEANLSRQGYSNARELTSAQTVVVEQLIQNLMGEIIDSTNVAYNSARNLYQVARLDNDIYRQSALASTAYTEALGKGAFYAGQSMEVAIRNHGITAFVDKRGRQWSLTDYCSMATRTTAHQAEVSAVLTKDDHDLYQIVKIGSTCPICAPLEGRVYSKSGMNPNYPPLSLAFGKIDPNGGDDLSNTYLCIHPNCLHSLIKYTEMGKTDKQIQKMRDFSNPETNPLDVDPRSKKQIEAYRTKERNRAKLLRELRKNNEKVFLVQEQTKITLNKNINPDSKYLVNSKFVNSQKYHANFENKGFKKAAMENAVEYGRQLLQKANGTEDEYQIAFDASTGKKVLDTLNRKAKSLKTSFTDDDKAIILGNRNKVIVIHNHPGSDQPSGKDIINMANIDKFEASIIACHNGDVYVIKWADKKVPAIYDGLFADAKAMCIQCGACFDHCMHEARDFDDDTAKYMATSRLYELNGGFKGSMFIIE